MKIMISDTGPRRKIFSFHYPVSVLRNNRWASKSINYIQSVVISYTESRCWSGSMK